MAPSAIRPRWQRIYRQTLTLIHKNFLIFYKAPISTLVRALVFPIVFTVIMCMLKKLSASNPSSSNNTQTGAIAASPTPILDLDAALSSSYRSRLVFVRNGISTNSIDPIINGIIQQPKMKGLDIHVTDDVNDLFDLCKQSVGGSSKCLAAVIFQGFNDTSIEYSIVLDSQVLLDYSQGLRTDNSVFATHILPIQWAIDSQVGEIPSSSKPSEQAWAGYFYDYYTTNPESTTTAPTNGPVWLAIIGMFVGALFILIPIGLVYHLSVFVATERQSSMSELMQAQMVTDAPRILSTLISFLVLYFPGLLVSSILLTQLLFVRTSDILFLFLTLLAGTSMTVSAHFMASFFGKAQLAGLFTSTLVFSLALVSLAATLLASSPFTRLVGGTVTAPTASTQVLVLSLIFPPYTWATLISDIANREYVLKAFSLAALPAPTAEQIATNDLPQQSMQGYLYVVFFIVQILLYGVATYFIERTLWGVKRTFEPIEASSNIALRCTNLSKTFYGKRPWYWPFMHKSGPNRAIDSLNLEVKRGSVTFLLGPNGGGKTTTLKCVAGMTAMDAGSRLEINEAGTVFGICPQQNVFWESLTVQQHINIWRRLKTAAFEDAITDDDDDVLGECDLIEKSKASVKTLSGGQRRKLQLAVAFVGGSKVCCIDEASSGLDPLSRRNIWNIIQKGQSLRTILVTTHFLDEADVLADHIAIVYKGKLVCEGPGTSLKANFGGDYIIRSESLEDGDSMVWRTSNSAEATRKILELEALTEDHTYNVVFPTLEQVFLKVTSDSNTAIRDIYGDGMVGEEDTTTAIDEKIFALETEDARDIDLDLGHLIGVARQIWTLFGKRHTLLLQKSGWISYLINLIIPIIIAAAFTSVLHKPKYFPNLIRCSDYAEELRNGTLSYGSEFLPLMPPQYDSTFDYSSTSNDVLALLGPEAAFSGSVQDALYVNEFQSTIETGYDVNTYQHIYNASVNMTLGTRELVMSSDQIIRRITNKTDNSFYGFGIWAPSPDATVLYYTTETSQASSYMRAFSLLTNRLANASTPTGTARVSTAHIRRFTHIGTDILFLSMPVAILLILAFVSASSIAVIYPTFEKINNVRALMYCNGVSPSALWAGYLLFDLQFIVLQAVICWAVMFAGDLQRLYFASSYIFGAIILYGIATYLGTYVLSLFVKKAAFAIAAGLHVFLVVIYLVGYIINQAVGAAESQYETYSLLQYVLGLTSPGANLLRALFVSMNVFNVLCGKYGDSQAHAFSYDRYGSVYANLLIQIIFLIAVLGIYEYGSADWFRRNVTHRGVPSRLHYVVDSGQAQSEMVEQTEKDGRATTTAHEEAILSVSNVSKFFGRVFATENISFDISSNETLALLGGNGAGKTTMINLIRGELKPDFGNITLAGISVLKKPHKARIYMGVCPQEDAVDNLTVRQTLEFYASVKGLRNVKVNVDKVLNTLNITIYEHVVVKALSGGTRRKLSVCIALLGNPRVLLLDEPSTGQDAGAKRILWKCLQDIRANRAILLTTHSMEEAEALATNVAIMGTKMLATGSLGHLQETYGGLYSVRAVRTPESTDAEVERMVKEAFEGQVANYADSHGQVSFNLPHDKRALGSILKVLEGLKGDVVEEEGGPARASGAEGGVRVLTDYTINGPTLEEVFMNVARENGTSGGV